MKKILKYKKIATAFLAAIFMTSNALSFQSPVNTLSTDSVAMAEDAVEFGSVYGSDESSYSSDKILMLLKHEYSYNYDDVLKEIFSDSIFKSYEVVSDPETANPEDFRLLVAADINQSGAEAVQAALDYLESFDEIYYAGPNQYFSGEIQWSGNDPGLKSSGLRNYQNAIVSSNAAYNRIKLFDAWNITTGSPSFVIGNAETLYYDHEDLKTQMWNNPDTSISERHGYNFEKNNNRDIVSVYSETNDHGTLTGGIMCAAGNNGKGSAGVAHGSKLMVTLGAGSDKFEDAIGFQNAINFLNKNSIKVYNVSLNWRSTRQEPVLAAIKSYKGLVFVAAGNDGINLESNPSYPASYSLEADNVICVGAVDSNDQSIFNYGGKTVKIAAPERVIGTGVYFKEGLSKPLSNYGIGGCTSTASPVVAGVASLIWSANPTLTAQQVKRILYDSADKYGKLQGFVEEGRRVNAYNALKLASIDAGKYFFRSKSSGRYLDLNTSTNKLITHDFNAGNNQKFEFGQGTLKTIYNNKYISAGSGTSTGISNVKSDIAIARNMSGDGFRIIRPERKAKNGGGEEVILYALTVTNPSSTISDVVWMEYNPNSNNQIWYAESANEEELPLVSGCVYTFTNNKSGKNLDLDQSNGNLIQYNAHGGNNQKWRLVKTGNNQYTMQTLSTIYPGKITRRNASPIVSTNGNIVLSFYKNYDQKGEWDNTYRIHVLGTCYCLKVQNNSYNNCASIVFDAYRNEDGSKWTFTKTN